MYSAVLAAILVSTPVTPEFCFKGCGCGCHRCSCHCYGCGCYGCGCYGCGCYGCGCYGHVGLGCGCYCYGCSHCSCSSCYCSCACYGCYSPVIVVPAVVGPAPKEEKKASIDQATVLVNLPADATLWIDGMKSNQNTASRSIVTPKLEAGRQYYYTVKAEIVRDGKTLVESKRVALNRGATSEVEFTEASLLAANSPKEEQAPARLTVKLPEDARLYVDNVECTLTSNVRSFKTPKLEAGQSYFYTLKAEAVRDGKTVSESKKVVLEAGKSIEVDFGSLATAVASK